MPSTSDATRSRLPRCMRSSCSCVRSAARIDSYSGSCGIAATIRSIQSSTIDSARKIVPKTRFTASCCRARQPAEALGVAGEVDAVGVPGVDVRGGDDVGEGPPGAGDLAVGGLVVGDQRVDLAQEARDLVARPRASGCGGQVRDHVHVSTLRRPAGSSGGGSAARRGSSTRLCSGVLPGDGEGARADRARLRLDRRAR